MTENTKSEDLQAVLVAETFSAEMSLLETPVSLIPIANVAAIDWTLEFLSRTSVKEVIVVCSTENAQVVEEHVSVKWKGEDQPFRLKFVSAKIQSVGDALREVDRRGNLIQSEEFLLLHAGVICNSDMRKSVAEHKQRRQKDKSCVMTLCYRASDPNHPSRSRSADFLVGYEAKTSRILSYQRLKSDDESAPTVDLALLESGEIDWRLDLTDCCMAICSKQIPPLFQDNFDYQSRDDLINEILENEELLGQKVHVSILDGFCGFATDLNSYLSLNWDILNRWAYPLTLDCCIPSQDLRNSYTFRHKNVYVHDVDATVGRKCLTHTVVVGEKTTIPTDSLVSSSSIGHHCVIGHNVRINNSVLWDHVVVHDNCRIENSIICTKAIVEADCHISERCIVEKGILVSKGTRLDPGTVLSERNRNRKDSGEVRTESWSVWHPMHFVKESEKLDSGGEESDQNCELLSSDEESDENQKFYGEILESLQKGVEDRVDVDTIRLEINSSKHAYGIVFDDLCQLFVKAVLSVRLSDVKNDSPLPHLQRVIKHVMPILTTYLKSPKSQLVALGVIEEMSLKGPLGDCLNELLFLLYNGDAVQEEAILQWAAALETSNQPVSKKAVKFVTWLKEAEEDSDE